MVALHEVQGITTCVQQSVWIVKLIKEDFAEEITQNKIRLLNRC